MALDGFEEGFVLGADGNRIAYLLHKGHAKKPAIVFVHGLGADALSFKPQLEHFRDRDYTVLGYDLRGHGKSDASTWPGFYNFDALARDLRAIVKSLLAHKQVVLVGHCIGGAIVMIYEEFYPGESERLFLLSSTANHRRSPLRIILRLYLRLTPSRYFHKRDRAERPYRTYQDPVVHDSTFRKQLRAISATNPINYAGLLFQFCNFDMRDELSGFKSPVTIVVGEFDSIFPIEHSVFLNEGIEGSELIILRDKNHLLPLQAADDVCRIIEERV